MATEGGARERDRDDDGQFADRIPLEAALAVFERQEDRARPLTASDVLEELDCSRRTVHNKLNDLVERGDLETRKVGARGRVWWRPLPVEAVDDPITDARHDDSFSEGATPVSDDELAAYPPAVRQAITEVDIPGTGSTATARREAVLAAYDYLTENPSAKKGDFLQDVFPEHPAEFQTADGWWNAIQPALKQLPGVDPPEERGHIWHFLGG
ncbi:ArsR family transcriptional regulator [Haloarchaeobius amylolyticus]|uniref:ArsR family transcriptional regulator n=1 Tax=Haloarchaeobius amylolyticus TaxID=1198296 RepID=UPI00227160D5|nr:ArsR family transcriptional regulator [Haloarchaeobius amylolyticus]